jgi:superoxide dismutase
MTLWNTLSPPCPTRWTPWRRICRRRPWSTTTASGALAIAIDKKWGSVDIVNTGNAGTPITGPNKPLLTLDVWEHAYYIDHRNLRPKFVEAFLSHLANWDFAAKNFS